MGRVRVPGYGYGYKYGYPGTSIMGTDTRLGTRVRVRILILILGYGYGFGYGYYNRHNYKQTQLILSLPRGHVVEVKCFCIRIHTTHKYAIRSCGWLAAKIKISFTAKNLIYYAETLFNITAAFQIEICITHYVGF